MVPSYAEVYVLCVFVGLWGRGIREKVREKNEGEKRENIEGCVSGVSRRVGRVTTGSQFVDRCGRNRNRHRGLEGSAAIFYVDPSSAFGAFILHQQQFDFMPPPHGNIHIHCSHKQTNNNDHTGTHTSQDTSRPSLSVHSSP